jgi:hypothetical protein
MSKSTRLTLAVGTVALLGERFLLTLGFCVLTA